MSEVRIASRFRDDLSIVESNRVLVNILDTIDVLQVIPSLGSTVVPKSITAQFGENVRKIPVSPFDIITVYYPEKDRVEVLGLIHQRAAW